jgi:glutamyl/glutaminyl-tRNA synthetase
LLSDIQPPLESKQVSETCNGYLKQLSLKSEDVFFLLRFAITGNPVGAPVGDICEIIGIEATIERLEAA